MSENERILLECRYLLSLNKNYEALANMFNISPRDVYNDLNIKLPSIDKILYQRVNKVLKKINCP